VKTDLNPFASQSALKPQGGPLKRGGAAPLSNVSPLSSGKDYQVDLSEAAKAPASAPSSLPSVPVPSAAVPDVPSLDLAEASKAVVEDAAKDKVIDEVKEEVIDKANKTKNDEAATENLKKPVIVFVSGWQWMYSPSKSEGSYAGVERMADAVEGARLYGWDQKKDILDLVKRTSTDQPIVLVGHSLGGDTVKEVADALDSLEYNFRKVDFLVTLDAVGFGNEIIPQNVKEHLNVFGENNFFLNDGPHVARRHENSKITNIISPLDHTELDDSKEIQFEILQGINRALKK
jgi:hypothetical protein